jgi:hypothetical protein
MTNPSIATVGLLLAGCCSLLPDTARAVIQDKWQDQNASGSCQGASQIHDDMLRKRPVGIANEGTVSAYVSCSLSVQHTGGQANLTSVVIVTFSNSNDENRRVTCTLVDGQKYSLVTSPRYHTKSVTVVANNSNYLSWGFESDNGGDRYWLPNLSCLIPPGVEINLVEQQYQFDVGQ